MRIQHLLTLVTPDGAYGGPLRVATNQIAELRKRGHDAYLVAGAAGFRGPLPREINGVPARLFPARRLVPRTGYAGLLAPSMLPQLRRLSAGADVVHVHLARELIPISAAGVVSALKRPYVVQAHGMIDPSDSALAHALDTLATRRILRGARVIFALVPSEIEGLRAVDPDLSRFRLLHNGVPPSSLRADVLSQPEEVLYLARLAPRKRPETFVAAAQALARSFPEVRFTLCGPDEGQGAQVRSMLAADDAGGRIRWEGPLPPDATAARMAQATIYVLPAIDEPFGMTLIEAMSVGLPTICIEDCGLADTVRAAHGEVVGRTTQDLIDGITTLLTGKAQRLRAAEAGPKLAAERTSMAEVVEILEAEYAQAVGGGR